jgi:hypothetical protein
MLEAGSLQIVKSNFEIEIMKPKLLVQAKQNKNPNYYKIDEKYDPYKNKTSYIDYDDFYDGLPIYDP